MEAGEGQQLTPFSVIAERARRGPAGKVVAALALFIAVLEFFYILKLEDNLADLLRSWGLEGLGNFIGVKLYLLSDIVHGLVMAALVAIGFLVFPVRRPPLTASEEELREFMKKYSYRIPWYDYVLAAVGFVVFVYRAYLTRYVVTGGEAVPESQVVPAIIASAIGFALVFELTRRAVGPWLATVVAVFLAYYFYNTATTTTYTKMQILEEWANYMYYGTSGLFNTPFNVMVNYVFAFLLFGTFLEGIGIGGYITRLMLSLFGSRPGGPAKVAIVSSGLMGMLSGSSVANVFTTGVFTIPLMKKAGFPPEVAGAVEASASTGGQIMPPIMGAAAFIMAAFIGRPYSDIVIAAFLPAFIYFASLYYFIDLEAKRRGLRGLRREELPPLGPLLRRLYLLTPIIVITALLVARLRPDFAVTASLSVAVLAAIWASDLPLGSKVSYTIAFAVVLGVALTGPMVGSMKLLAAIYLASLLYVVYVAVAGYVYRKYRGLSSTLVSSMIQAARNSVPVFMAAAMAGVIQGSLTLTGLVGELGPRMIQLAHGYLYLLLVFAAIISLIVGMGVPTTANYVITSLISASAITSAIVASTGVPEAAAVLAAHMFVFYYGILADVTPPVALAAFAGATVARADFWKTAVNATRMAFAKYVLPFVFAVNPALLVLPIIEGHVPAYYLAWGLIVIVGVIVAASAGFAGYLAGHIREKWLRAFLSIAGILAIGTGVPRLPEDLPEDAGPATIIKAFIETSRVYLLALAYIAIAVALLKREKTPATAGNP